MLDQLDSYIENILSFARGAILSTQNGNNKLCNVEDFETSVQNTGGKKEYIEKI